MSMRAVCCLSLVILIIASGVPPIYAQNVSSTEATPGQATAPPEPSVPLVQHMYNIGQPFALNCTQKHNPDGIKYQWKKNGTLVEEWTDLKGRYTTEPAGTFQLKGRSTEDDFGNYTCAVQGSADMAGWQVLARVHVKVQPDVNVVEGQKLKLQCKLYGKPYPGVTWTFSNESDANGTEVGEALGERVLLARTDQGVEGGELVLSAVVRGDAGRYTCAATGPDGATASDTTTVRVKDMYAALWPFLGICAEVFILCAIILVYEKRRTKPEHDDSDTENHDQKKS